MSASQSNGSYTLLIAEDDADDRTFIKEALVNYPRPLTLTFVEDGDELLRYLAGDGPRPRLVLLDVNMPRKDGKQALREMRAEPSLKTLPVVAFTTSTSEDLKHEMLSLGANWFVSKPNSHKVYVQALTEILDTWMAVWQPSL